MAPAVQVIVQDVHGGTATGSTASVTLTITPGTGTSGAVLGGTVTQAAVGGVATFGDLMVTKAGTGYTLTATSYGLGGAKGAPFSVTSNGTVVALAGETQFGLVGYPVNVRPAVRVTDPGGAPVTGRSVTFTVAAGGGSITGASATTNSDGVAQIASWVVGTSPGSNHVVATVAGAGLEGNPFTFTATAQTSAFNITVQNVGPQFSPAVQAAFAAATSKWQRIIYQDLADFSLAPDALPPDFCYEGQPQITSLDVDDVLIFAKVDSIDGPNGILGQSYPCAVRRVGFLPLLGYMEFDSADVALLVTSGELDEVMVHEMGHVLGFGTLWPCLQSPSNPPGTILDTYFNCGGARAAFDSMGGTSYTGGNKVPVENCGPASPAACGAGTVNSHWREPVFKAELMTGYLDPGVPNALSRLTAASMEDLGYGVNLAGADPYSQPFSFRAGGSARPLRSLGNDVLRRPIYVLDHTGRVARVIQPR
jgi:hypothetical protein